MKKYKTGLFRFAGRN